MGTNYYLIKNKSCPTCGHHATEELHVGKSSAGWKFAFAAKTAPDFAKMFALIFSDEYTLVDEYEKVVTKAEFLQKVLMKQLEEPAYTHETYYKENWDSKQISAEKIEYIDPWGFRFCKGEFS